MAGVRVATGAGVGPDPQAALDTALADLDAGLGGEQPDVVCAFLGSAYAGAADRVAGAVHEVARAASAGVTAQGVVADGAEIERPEALALWGLAADGLGASPLRLEPPHDGGVEWPLLSDEARCLLVLGDPFTFPADAFLAWAGQARPGVPVVGGLASGGARPGTNRLLLDGRVHDDGAVGLALEGIRLRAVVSQGCRPIGDPRVVTGAEGHLITGLAGEPPTDRLRALYAEVDDADRALMQTGLHLGIVIDEYAETHEPGGFLVRAVLGAQQHTGALAVGDLVGVGQTVQFHVRDADSADEDLRATLERFVAGSRAAGALLFTCNGRGRRLFGEPDHDAALVRDALGSVPVAGFFAAGELGPVGSRSFVHGFTASLLAIEETEQM